MKILFFILPIIVSVISQAQQLSSEEAETLFSQKRFSGVWDYFQVQLKKDSLNTNLNYKMGVCYLNSRSQKEKSIGYFKKALAKNDLGKQKQSHTYKLLGDAYYFISDFDQAILHYEKYRSMYQGESNGDISKELEMCKMANDLKELKELTANLTDNKNGSKKNRKNLYAYHETLSTLKQPSSISIPLKKTSTDIGSYGKNFYEEIQEAHYYNFKHDPKKTDTTEDIMETTIATSVDGQIILIYKDDNGNGNLYCSSLHGNEWIQPEQLSKNIINKSWEPNEFVSTNGNELYFSSKREGGFGGKDIYKCMKLSNGEWGKAINMGSRINTKYDEEAPYVFPDGVTLYFSSNRNRKKDFFDNFSSIFSDSTGWVIPQNIGYPVYKKNQNLKNDSGSTIQNNDNFIATFINLQNKPITILSGTVTDKKRNIPSYIEITIANNETGEIIGIYHPSAKTGKYAFIIPPGKNQNISYESQGYLFHSENINLNNDPNIYQLNKLIELEPIAEGSKIKLNNIFFDDGKTSISSGSDIEINKLANFLTRNPTIQVEIAAYTSKKSNDDRIKQTEGRIQSLLNYLFEKGVDKKNIRSEIYKKTKTKISGPEVVQFKSEQLELKVIALK
ncbi:MAG: PD40 domain-containing protein [Burkholderiales bacterium]|nr:PD40 domain-containing protein [Bacteroidia bacterium]